MMEMLEFSLMKLFLHIFSVASVCTYFLPGVKSANPKSAVADKMHYPVLELYRSSPMAFPMLNDNYPFGPETRCTRYAKSKALSQADGTQLSAKQPHISTE
ncbi:hypothetical protein EDC04DRAFT_2191371 [Pisolithus marmoratus]|nr:hypothetical protein EDC04DRAFT_2191371 [Pisolithus marmoratus]